MAVLPPASISDGYELGRWARNAWVLLSSSSYTMPRNWTSRKVRAAAASAACSSKHGTHQVAQKFITTGRPRSESRLIGPPPPTGASEKGGAGRPIRGERIECGSRPRLRSRTASRGRTTTSPTTTTFAFTRGERAGDALDAGAGIIAAPGRRRGRRSPRGREPSPCERRERER